MPRVLYLHGLNADPFGGKRAALDGEEDFVVEAPALQFPSVIDIVLSALEPSAGDGWGYARSCAIAQAAADGFEPDVIVGSSMGGAVALSIASPAARVLIAPATKTHGLFIPGIPQEWLIPVRTVILHSGRDEFVPFDASGQLLEHAAGRATPEETAVIDTIRQKLQALGYAVSHDRLVRIGRNHQCNEPDPGDTANREPDPHLAMIRAVRIVADVGA